MYQRWPDPFCGLEMRFQAGFGPRIVPGKVFWSQWHSEADRVAVELQLGQGCSNTLMTSTDVPSCRARRSLGPDARIWWILT